MPYAIIMLRIAVGNWAIRAEPFPPSSTPLQPTTSLMRGRHHALWAIGSGGQQGIGNSFRSLYQIQKSIARKHPLSLPHLHHGLHHRVAPTALFKFDFKLDPLGTFIKRVVLM